MSHSVRMRYFVNDILMVLHGTTFVQMYCLVSGVTVLYCTRVTYRFHESRAYFTRSARMRNFSNGCNVMVLHGTAFPSRALFGLRRLRKPIAQGRRVVRRRYLVSTLT